MFWLALLAESCTVQHLWILMLGRNLPCSQLPRWTSEAPSICVSGPVLKELTDTSRLSRKAPCCLCRTAGEQVPAVKANKKENVPLDYSLTPVYWKRKKKKSSEKSFSWVHMEARDEFSLIPCSRETLSMGIVPLCSMEQWKSRETLEIKSMYFFLSRH